MTEGIEISFPSILWAISLAKAREFPVPEK